MQRTPEDAMHEAYDLVCKALNLLIPIPNIYTHNVALTLDETVRSFEDAMHEMNR